jgi:hypothetical protein
MDGVFDTQKLDMTRCADLLIDHVNRPFRELDGVAPGERVIFDRTVDVPDYGLPAGYVLVSPFGYSQFATPDPRWLIDKARAIVGASAKIFCLADGPKHDLPVPVVTAQDVSHLPELVRRAAEFFTINSAPNIIAAAVRRSYFHVWDKDPVNGRTNYVVPGQTTLRWEK